MNIALIAQLESALDYGQEVSGSNPDRGTTCTHDGCTGNQSIMRRLNPSSRIATSERNDCTQRCVACGRRDCGHRRVQHAFRAHENKTRTGMKYSWETRD